MQICRRGRKDPCWCSSRHRRHLGSRLCRSSAQVRPKTNGETASRKGCRRPAEPNRVVSRRDVVRCLSCLHRKVPEQFLGEGVLATAPPYPTGCWPGQLASAGLSLVVVVRQRIRPREFRAMDPAKHNYYKKL